MFYLDTLDQKKSTGIYVIQQKSSGKKYIGSTKNSFAARWRSHLCELRNNKHHSIHLQRSWNKYGEDDFEFIIVRHVQDDKEVLVEEQRWLDTINPEFNISKKVGGNSRVVRQETIDKIKATKAKNKTPMRWVNKNGNESFIKASEIDQYINSGWAPGRSGSHITPEYKEKQRLGAMKQWQKQKDKTWL
jgi:group I intron endonuclease